MKTNSPLSQTCSVTGKSYLPMIVLDPHPSSGMFFISERINITDCVIITIGTQSDESICYFSYDNTTSDEWSTSSKEEMKKYQFGRGIPGSAGLNIGSIQIRLRVQVLQGIVIFLSSLVHLANVKELSLYDTYQLKLRI